MIDYYGDIYYADKENGKLQSGKIILNGKVYYFDNNDNCKAKTGWIEIDGEKYYADKETKQFYNLVHEVDGEKYFFGRTTYKVLKGWINYNGDIYYADPETGRLKRNINTVEGKSYFFGVTGGIVQYGWISYQGKTYYADPGTGVLFDGTKKIDGNWYNFGSDFTLKTGWQNISGNSYYFFADGSRARGVQKVEGQRCLFSNSGELLKKGFKLWIDVSYAQGNIDWDSLWKSGDIDGAILRIGAAAHIEDAKFKRNIAAVKRLGIPYSIYYFSYAENTDEALQEAKNMIMLYKKYGVNTSIPTYYDIEYYTHMTQAQYADIIKIYSNYAKQNGVDVKVYASARFAEQKLLNYTDWVAHYTGKKVSDNPSENIYDIYPTRITDYKGKWNIWQYSNNGHVTGIEGRVDLDIVLY